MTEEAINISADTRAVLMLTAPLSDFASEAVEYLRPSEYQRFAKALSQLQLKPGDLLTSDDDSLYSEFKTIIDADRFKRLLDRGFQLGQAIERWQARSIWILSPTDEEYPERLRARLKDYAPALLYGCGHKALLGSGGLAVVGSRNVDPWLIEYTEGIGRLAAAAKMTIISGGARGIDQASMRGTLQDGGKALGILADSLERAALHRENRPLFIEDRLVLASTFDPSAGFNVGHAMQRNKLLYALADAALVVNSDLETGGTWAGAVEQLEKLNLVTVYVRSKGEIGEGLRALERRGGVPWPNPATPDELIDVLSQQHSPRHAEQLSLL